MSNVTTAVPTTDQAMALGQFIQDRNDEEFQRALADPKLSDAATETLRRVSNVAKLATTGTLGYLLSLLGSTTAPEAGQAARLWDLLTGCGEQWEDHPDWKPQWGNHSRAKLHANLGIG